MPADDQPGDRRCSGRPSTGVLPVSHDGGRRSAGPWRRAAILVGLIAAASGIAVTSDVPTVGDMATALDGAGRVGWATAALGLALVLAVPAPRSALSVLAGAVAGFSTGFALVVVGGLAGGLLGFGLSRWLGRDAAARLLGRRLALVDRLARERGFLTVLTARLLPAPPFAVVSYVAGLSGVRLAPYALGTTIGLLPGSLFYVGVGVGVGVGASATDVSSWVPRLDRPLQILAVLVGTVALTAAWWLRRRRSMRTGRRSGTGMARLPRR